MPASPPLSQRRTGYVALIGAPNAGKSTLLNRFVGSKISIVTHKVQTTRTRILGVAMHNAAQIMFIDTPGIFRPRRRLDRAMVAAAWSSAADADATLLLVDAAAPNAVATGAEIAARMKEVGGRKLLVLNKVDAVRRETLLELTNSLKDAAAFDKIFMISARRGSGTRDLMNYLAETMPVGDWLFSPDDLTDMPQRLLAAEITREQLFLNLHQELPYELTVETESWEETPKGVLLSQVIHVRRDGHRVIVIGKAGATIKRIGSVARREMIALFGRPVHLQLFVRVTPKWDEDPQLYKDWNLDFG